MLSRALPIQKDLEKPIEIEFHVRALIPKHIPGPRVKGATKEEILA
jgi:hypothetical protein